MATLFGSQLAAFSYLVFILLYAPCVAVLGATAKEAGWRWTALIFAWTTGLAYVVASCVFQVGSFADHPLYSALWLLGCLALSTVAIMLLKRVGQHAVPVRLIPAIQL